MEDPVAEEPGEPDEPAVWIRRMDDAQGIGKRRPNGGLVVVIGLTPADGAVKCDHVHCLGPLPGHHEEGPISRTEKQSPSDLDVRHPWLTKYGLPRDRQLCLD